MFKIFKKNKSKDITIFSPVKGKVIPIEYINDGVFSEKMLGDGFAVIPNSNEIYSPVIGKVVNIFPTKHAIGIQTDAGLEILIHIGLDTVELNGEPFELLIDIGETVDENTLLMKVDWPLIEAKGKGNPVIVVFTDTEIIDLIEMKTDSDTVEKQPIGLVQLK
ncbi:PTS glucose transporter subunit IIA [Enterococcus hirae]|uniref:PTS sugar transporter subunit IIA n=1 Tax=Enterococcus TaxID=1350 RepID=UPI0015992172|nr:PTS glucose transporter subunit IIA [Enterococcus hirae]EMF0110698.1 PTS glucose transporter subunit IIA [Enterococcus hirae]EMF0261436.1 PTS glucose transporter subunit IIA [Enterococcus hirae]EMF0277719.1 PTS glucose transporter subunit IIA [Enterococcus hirae]EMF0380090.1 PTS glucose transporter subunit IIA [Enterococcus hirae]EMF0396228.1 PTS glucose transporter subunit IIA [Enterococcus hirae]